MPRKPTRVKKVSYVLQVSCDKIPNMNEAEFLKHVRDRLTNIHNDGTPALSFARVSVLKRIEEFVKPGDDK